MPDDIPKFDPPRKNNEHRIDKALQSYVDSKGLKKHSKARALRKSAYDFNLYDVIELRNKLIQNNDAYPKPKNIQTLEKMAENSGVARLRKQPRNFNTILNNLESEYPHFKNVICSLRKKMKLNSLQKHPYINFGRGMLLTGPAGTGKSSFLFKLSEALQTEFHSYSCAASSNAFDLVGLSPKWGNGNTGKIHEILVEKKCPNPIILLDEIEKVGDNDRRFSSLTDALYGLLEKNNARYFHDEFVSQKMDASKINWFATANDASLLDAPIRDRFDVVEVRAPTASELKTMIPGIYKKTLIELNVQEHFISKLDTKVIKFLSHGSEGASIRLIKVAIEDGISSAVSRYKRGEKLRVTFEDVSGFSLSEEVNNKPIGFIWNNGGEPSQIH